MPKEKLRLDRKTGEFVQVLTEKGQEIPDPTPMAPPVGYKRHVPLHERIRAMVQHEYLRARQHDEYETPEEADDFLVGDEDDPREGRFAMMPGHEHDWEENYEPPKDFKDMRQRLVDAGWTPPAAKDEAKPARAPSGGAPATSEGHSPASSRDGSKGKKPSPRSDSDLQHFGDEGK